MQISDVIARRYELREALGGGGLGRVFRAFDERALREVAVKVLDAPRSAAARLGPASSCVGSSGARAARSTSATTTVESSSPFSTAATMIVSSMSGAGGTTSGAGAARNGTTSVRSSAS